MFLENLSKFISNYNYEQSSKETISLVKTAFMDFFGVTYCGASENSPQIAFNTINELFFGNNNFELEASVIGKINFKTNFLNASFLNAIAAHTLELDDGHRKAQIHLGAVVFPTALAISEAYDLDGKTFLEGVIVGYKAGILLGEIANPQHRNNGFHTTGTIGTFVAGAVASKLLNFDESQILNTLGLCGTQAAGLLESDHGGSMGKVLHVGKATYNGLLSAFLALNGFTGSETIFEGKEGFLNTMVFPNNKEIYLDNILKKLEEINLNDIYFKKYPFCRHLHSSIDIALKLKTNIGEEYEHIEKIVIKTYDVAAQHNNYDPKNIEELKQSLPYAVAIALVCGDITLNKLNKLIKFGLLDNYSTVDKVNSIKKLANNIIIISNNDLNELYPNKRPSDIVIKLDDVFKEGIFQNISLLPKGDFENPYQLNELLNKFKSLNPDYDVDKLNIIKNIENYNISEVMELLNG